jgi:hypothetical protein
VSTRYQRAEDLLTDLIAERRELVRRPTASTAPPATPTPAGAGVTPRPTPGARSTPPITRVRARETPTARFCWQCRKPLPARGIRCPFCGETQ